MMFRKYLVFCFLCIMFNVGCTIKYEGADQKQYATVNVVENYVVDENSVPIFPKKASLTTDTVQHFSIDLPKRCRVDWDNQNVVSVVPAEYIEMIRLNVGDVLPDLQVSDYSFKQKTVVNTLRVLLKGTDIDVVTDENINELITGDIENGNLTDVVDLIAKLGRVYYSYDESVGELRLSNNAKWLIKMPKNESIIMALLDAMHGADVRNLLVDWDDKTVVFEGNYQTEREVSKIIADISNKKYMLAWDMDVYRVYPRMDGPIVWMDMLSAFGTKNIKMSIPGVVGRALVVGPEINTKTLQEFLSKQSNVVLISQGTFVIPNGWQSRFDIGQCSKEDRLETDLVVGATGKYGDYAGYKKIEAKIVLQTSNGELSSFEIPSTLGNNYVIIGVPTHSFVTTPETLISPFAELVVFMSPRLVAIENADDVVVVERLGIVGDELRDLLNR